MTNLEQKIESIAVHELLLKQIVFKDSTTIDTIQKLIKQIQKIYRTNSLKSA